MSRVQVELKPASDQSYDIEIERGFFKRIASDLRMKRFAENYVVITDSKVGRLYAGSLVASLKREKLFLGKIVVPAGEDSKSLGKLEEILGKLIELGAHRKTGIIALGGGVVGDLAGFASASYMRGLSYVQVPTSLLAMIDSSVGGKVGVDLPGGKNMAGAFWQPKKVYVDPDLLSTLPNKQWKSGLGEAVKYGAIKDMALWDFFEHNVNVFNKSLEKLLPSDWKIIEDFVRRCIQMKVEIVMKDEKEENLRQILNYGHTFGHVIELMSNYKILHGEAVATGMRMAAAIAVELRFMPVQEFDKQNKLLDELGIGKSKTKGLIKDFVGHMKKDKKADGKIKLVLIDRLGRCHQDMGRFSLAVDEKIIKEVLRKSGLIDDVEVRGVGSVGSVGSVGTVGSVGLNLNSGNVQNDWNAPSYGSTQSYSSIVHQNNETDLQRRLREMRERRERAQREGGKWLPG